MKRVRSSQIYSKIIIIFNALFLLTALQGCAEDIEVPSHTNDAEIHEYTGFVIEYSEPYEQAKWVAYELTSEEVVGTHPRTNDFRADSNVSTGSASLADYKRSGFDRGHLAPAGDMKWSLESMSESFLMSNMSPQRPGFNRGIWKKLEEQVRE